MAIKKVLVVDDSATERHVWGDTGQTGVLRFLLPKMAKREWSNPSCSSRI